jgi:hypothetical protein
VKPEGVGQDIARWIKDNAKAMLLISTTIESEQLEPLLVCVTAKEMWEKLTSVHEQKSASNKLLLTTRLYEYRMSPGDQWRLVWVGRVGSAYPIYSKRK